MGAEDVARAGQHGGAPAPRRITMLSGGVGGAKFARGLRHLLQQEAPLHEVAVREPSVRADLAHAARDPDRQSLTCVVNTGDDMWLHGLRVCPDLDSMMYGLAGVNDRDRGWGRAGESERVSAELLAYGVGVDWFTLGDLDLATHIARTQMLRAGSGLAHVTRSLSSRWDLGAALLPATEHQVETRVRIGARPEEAIHFEEWWVRHRARLPARGFLHDGASDAAPAPGVLEAIESAELLILAPSNPIVSIGAILAIPGIMSALRAARAPVIGISPIIGSSHVLGMASQCLRTVGAEVSAAGVAEHFGARVHGGLLDGWLVDSSDAASVSRVEAGGIPTMAVPLFMDSEALTAEMARAVHELADRVAPGA